MTEIPFTAGSNATAPILLTTWSFGLRAGRRAWDLLAAGGGALDAVELASIDAEEDPVIDSVGYGGLPDRDGDVTLDACVMLSPRRCGAICALRATRRAASVARRVMERTPHLLLAGAGADAFARAEAFCADTLLSPEARAAWDVWRAAPHTIDQSIDQGVERAVGAAPPRPVDQGPAGRLFGRSAAPGDADSPFPADEARYRHHDTIGALALDASGVLAGACSTSGTPYKLPGRVGDSPIVGHGLYVDPGVGAATATGTGELVMGTCGSFLAVEFLRQGAPPVAAVERTLRRIADAGPLESHHQVALIVLRADGAWSAGALRSGYRTTCWMGGASGSASGSGGSAVEPQVVLFPEDRQSSA